MNRERYEAPFSVRIPVDVDRPDRILGSFTARQVAILAGAGGVLWVLFMATRNHVPLALFGIGAVPVIAVAVAFALVRRDGLSLDRLAFAAARQRLSPRRLVAGEVAATPGFLVRQAGRAPSPLGLPVTGIREDGVVELGPLGCGAIVACSTVSFALATWGEQEAMVAGFARCLHGLTAPIQVLIRAERLDITPMAVRIGDAAPGLPDPALEDAAREHARFLGDLAARSELLWRQVLVVVRDDPADPVDGEATQVLRRAEQVAAALTATGVESTVLDGAGVAAVLSAACDPNNPAPFPPTSVATVITGGPR
jgi:PrgI family protein